MDIARAQADAVCVFLTLPLEPDTIELDGNSRGLCRRRCSVWTVAPLNRRNGMKRAFLGRGDRGGSVEDAAQNLSGGLRSNRARCDEHVVVNGPNW